MMRDWQPWFRCFLPWRQPKVPPRLRLVCFPHAGGSASFFAGWAKRMPPPIELLAVQYPGREARLGEPMIDDMDQLAERVAAALEPALDRPLLLFGHSVGAAVAAEVAVRLEPRRVPEWLIVSALPAPSRLRTGRAHQLADDELTALVRGLGGPAAEMLDEPDLRAALLPALRNDYRLIETYRPPDGLVLDTPILALVGETDPEVDLADAEAWGEHTRARFALKRFAGGHFYLCPREQQVVAEVLRCAEGAGTKPTAWPSRS